MVRRADIKAQFDQDIAEHQMTVELDQGAFRSLFFSKPQSGNMHFRIVTWPGYLAFTGDMGAFVFCRTHDMFDFFRDDEGRINPSYWSEKVVAECPQDKVRQFNFDLFKHEIVSLVADAPLDAKADFMDALAIAEQDEYGAVQLIREANWDALGIDDPPFPQEFSYRYLWCCHAVVWAIQQYDKNRPEPKPLTEEHKGIIARWLDRLRAR